MSRALILGNRGGGGSTFSPARGPHIRPEVFVVCPVEERHVQGGGHVPVLPRAAPRLGGRGLESWRLLRGRLRCGEEEEGGGQACGGAFGVEGLELRLKVLGLLVQGAGAWVGPFACRGQNRRRVLPSERKRKCSAS